MIYDVVGREVFTQMGYFSAEEFKMLIWVYKGDFRALIDQFGVIASKFCVYTGKSKAKTFGGLHLYTS